MLRVLYLPLNDLENVQQGTYDAFQAVGVKLEICDFHRVWLNTKSLQAVAQDFLNKVKNFQPHLVHMQLQFTGLISSATIKQARQLCPSAVFTNWSGDIREGAIPEFTSIASVIDHSLISSTGQLQKYRTAGCKNVKYWQIGYDPKLSYPQNKTEFKYDIAFTANNYGTTFPDGPLRSGAANALRKEFGARFGLFGSGYGGDVKPIAPKGINGVYNDSLAVLSISNFNNVSHYFSDRLLYCLASGRPTISWHFPGCESYFVDGSEIFYAKSYDEIVNIVKRLKANPELAMQIGRNGYNRVFREHTLTSRVIELLHMTNLIHLV